MQCWLLRYNRCLIFRMPDVADPLRLLAAATKRSQRQYVQFATSFFKRKRRSDNTPPLTRLVRGGRGGEVRLKLYATLCVVCVGAPHDVWVVPHEWAEMLGLPDPDRNGARRIRSALRWLNDAKLIRVEQGIERNPRAFLRDQAGNGKTYHRPKDKELYASVPIEFWSNGWILVTPPSAIALLIILIDLQYKRSYEDRSWVKSKWVYDLSDDTWTKGAAALSELGLLEVTRIVKGGRIERRRLRNLYWVDIDRIRTERAPGYAEPEDENDVEG